jgi:hypothetical protein
MEVHFSKIQLEVDLEHQVQVEVNLSRLAFGGWPALCSLGYLQQGA